MKQNLLEMVLLFVSFYLPATLFPAQALQLANASPGRFMLEAILTAVPQLLLLLYVLWLREKNTTEASQPAGVPQASGQTPLSKCSPWHRFGLTRFRAGDLPQGALAFAGALALLLAVNLTFSLLPSGGRELLAEGFRFRLGDWRLIPLVLVFGIVTGYREELFFRGYLITRFTEIGIPKAAAVAASSLLFGLGHLYQGLAGLVTALALGALFGILFLRRRNLHRLAIAHGLYNTLVLVASLWAASWSGPPPGPA